MILPLMKSDLLNVMLACTNGTLDETEVEFSDESACCVILASGGYPVSYQKGYLISGLENAAKTAKIYHAGTKRNDNGGIVTSGGRVLGVTATAKDLKSAVDKAYAAAKKISFTDCHMRTDIGQRALRAL